MATIYTPETKLLNEFLNEILDINSNVVIPDLQRPYIWNPQQVILLVDSIFRKWPFGSLLCWNVKIKNGCNDFIPFRPFWTNVVRGIPSREPQKASYKAADKYVMILDGQQRIQSLLLALGGDSWGFTLTDKDWKRHLEGKDESIDPKHWSSGCLCLEIARFLREYEKCCKRISAIDVGKCISWAVTDESTGLSGPKNHVLPLTTINDGKFIRFSQLWRLARPVGLLATDYEESISETFCDVKDELLNQFLKPLSELMTIIADVKDSTTVTRLVVKDFDNSGISDRKLYNNAIVNIFARLNTAGRALTPQEITLAWLKTGWMEAQKESNGSGPLHCADALHGLLGELNDQGGDISGLQMTMDDLVDILTLISTILEKDGERKEDMLLSDNDLVDGDIVKRIGYTTFNHWDTIQEAILDCKQTFENRSLNECFSRSLYAFNIICGWKFVALKCEKTLGGRIREKECMFTTQVNGAFDDFIDRWYFCTQLSDTWSRTESYPNYLSRLCKLRVSINSCSDPNRALEVLRDSLDDFLATTRQQAITRINQVMAFSRREVIAYKNLLWLWNRLSLARWNEVQKPMKRKRATPKLEVDHSIPVAIWNVMVESTYPKESSIDPKTGNEITYMICDSEFTRSKLLYWINSIGNCSLLLRSHNRSKNDEPFGVFLADIYSPQQIETLKMALLLSDCLLDPIGKSISDIISAINKRSALIKDELIAYLNNTGKRFDVA